MSRLVVIEGPWCGLELSLDPGERVLGRSEGCDLSVPDSALSREHCKFTSGADGWIVEDLGSRNGMSYNGKRAERARLSPGDRLGIGSNLFRFVDEDDPVLLADSGSVTRTFAAPLAELERLEDSWRADQLADLLSLSEQIAHAPATAELERLFSAWLLSRFGGARVTVLHPRSGRTVATAVFTRDGRRERPTSISAPPDAAVAALRNGTCSFFDRSGSMIVPLGAPASIVFVVEGVAAAPSPEELRMAAFAARLAAGSAASLFRAEVLESRGTERSPIIAESAAMKRVLDLIERVAKVDATVLILGESGSGKELVARAVHAESARSAGPFVAVNCAAMPEHLVESELFGHEKGAFTGALERRAGRFERAHRGTLFLDEVGDLPLAAQAKLLRVLEDRQVERVGGAESVPIDVRILAATHRDLQAMVEEGAFRSDLYYRLSVLVTRLPALRERPEDITAIAEHFLAELGGRVSKHVVGFSAEAKAALAAHRWPGNVRELRNAIEHALILGTGARIEASDLPFEVRSTTATPGGVRGAQGDLVKLPLPQKILERENLFAALRATGGNKSQAARLLGLDRATLYARLKEVES